MIEQLPTLAPSTLVCIAVVLFVLLSKLLEYFPGILHKTKSGCMGTRRFVQKIAHRGSCCSGLPENTIAAFKDAAVTNCDMIELDVWFTSDEKVVVHHDETLTRMTDGKDNRKIHEASYATLPAIRPQNMHNSKVKDQTSKLRSYNGPRSDWEKIPLLGLSILSYFLPAYLVHFFFAIFFLVSLYKTSNYGMNLSLICLLLFLTPTETAATLLPYPFFIIQRRYWMSSSPRASSS